MELLGNTFWDEMKTFIPILLTFTISVAVTCLVLATKLAGVTTSSHSFLLLVAFGGVDYTVSTFLFLRMLESLGTESLGLLDELGVDAAIKLKKSSLARKLTRRRLIRPRCGHVMYIESGTALEFLMKVLDNTVSGTFLVVPGAQSYFFK